MDQRREMTESHAVLRAARTNMVDSQVRPNQVNDSRVIAAMRELPREAFAPAGSNPYADMDIPLGGGRFLLAPLVIARLTQVALAAHPKKILVVGAGSGYGAALLALSGARVVALEDEARLNTDALAKYAPSVTCVSGPLAKGWALAAPYDCILVEGALAELPLDLAGQLGKSGQLVAILAQTSAVAGLGAIVVAEPGRDGFASRRLFDCTARILPAFQPAAVFEF
jgi:protein-L-isoaspartate(D-aspartate) O-methyltransferase